MHHYKVHSMGYNSVAENTGLWMQTAQTQ